MTIYSACKAQIALFNTQKITGLIKHTNFGNIFSKKLAEILSEWTHINKHSIKLVNGKQLPCRPIYSLGLVKLKTSKTYIKTNLALSFIQPSKSLADAPILFIFKLDGSFCLCIND